MFLQFGAHGLEPLKLPAAYLAERSDDFVTELQVPVAAARKARPAPRTKARRQPKRGRITR